MDRLINKKDWAKVLTGSLPGEKAHLEMAPKFRGEFIHAAEPAKAAVMILLYPRNERASTIFIKRNEYPGHHSAQVSFPGGAREESDLTLEYTAVRETREELGITDHFEVLGSLTDLYIPVSNFLVTPFVGALDHRPVFQPDGTEVQFLIETSLCELANPAIRGCESLFRHGKKMMTPYYRVGNEKIWGATAMILSEFLQVVSTLQ